MKTRHCGQVPGDDRGGRGRQGLALRSLSLLSAAALVLLGCSRRPPTEEFSLGISIPYEFDTLDPHAHSRVASFMVLSHLYEALVRTDAGLEIRPALAVRWTNPDPLTWAFFLDPGARFHDGRPVEAADVVFTFERLLTRKDLAISGYLSQVASVRAVDSHQVEVRTLRPASALLGKLTFVAIVPRRIPPEGLPAAENGSGPYRLVEWHPGRLVRMVRDESYPGTRPSPREVTFRLGGSDHTCAADVLEGRSQIVRFGTGSPGPLATLAGREDLRTFEHGGLYVTYLSFDLRPGPRPPGARRNPFLDPRVRAALHSALDRRALARKIGAGSFPATQPVPASIFGHDPLIPVPEPSPEVARRLLAEAGYPDGLGLTLRAPSRLVRHAEAVRLALAAIGVTVDLGVSSDTEFFRAIREARGDAFLSRFGCSSGDAGELVDMAIHSPDAERRFGSSNYGGFSDGAIDGRIEESATVADLTERRAALQGLMRELMARLVWIPLTVDRDAYAADRRLAFSPRLDGHILAGDVSLADQLRKR